MQILDIVGVGTDYDQRWPDSTVERYATWIMYKARDADGEHQVRIAFGERQAYGRNRPRVLVVIDGSPIAEFLGADDFAASGEVLSEIKAAGAAGHGMCRYPDDALPAGYMALQTAGLPTRISGPGVRSAWMVVANVCDHRSMIALASLRRAERMG